MPLSNQNERSGVTFATYSGWRSYLDGRNRGKKTSESSLHGNARHTNGDKSNNRQLGRILTQTSSKKSAEGMIHNTSVKPSPSLHSLAESDSCGSVASLRSLPVGRAVGPPLLTRNSHDLCMLKSYTDTADCGYIDATIRPYMQGRMDYGARSGGVALSSVHSGSGSLTRIARNILGSNTSLGGCIVNNSRSTNMFGSNPDRAPKVFALDLNKIRGGNNVFNNSANNNNSDNNNNANITINNNNNSGSSSRTRYTNTNGGNKNSEVFDVGLNKGGNSIKMVNNNSNCNNNNSNNNNNNNNSNSNNNNYYNCEQPEAEENIDYFGVHIFELAVCNGAQENFDEVENLEFKHSIGKNSSETYTWEKNGNRSPDISVCLAKINDNHLCPDAFKRCRSNVFIPTKDLTTARLSESVVYSLNPRPPNNKGKAYGCFSETIRDKPYSTGCIKRGDTPLLCLNDGSRIQSSSDNTSVYHNSNNNSSRSSPSNSSGSNTTTSTTTTTTTSTSYPTSSACVYEKRLSTAFNTEDSSEMEPEQEAEEDVYTSVCDTYPDENSQTPLSATSSCAESCCTSSCVTDSPSETRYAVETGVNVTETFASCFTHKSQENSFTQSTAATLPSIPSDTLEEERKRKYPVADTSRQVRPQFLYERSSGRQNQRDFASQEAVNGRRELNCVDNKRYTESPNNARPERARLNAPPEGGKAVRHDKHTTSRQNNVICEDKACFVHAAVERTPSNKGKTPASHLKPQTNAPTANTYIAPTNNVPEQNGNVSHTKSKDPTPTVRAANVITPIKAMCALTSLVNFGASTPPKPTKASSPKQLEICMTPQATNCCPVPGQRHRSNKAFHSKMVSPQPRTRRTSSLGDRKNFVILHDSEQVKPKKPRSFTNISSTQREQRPTNRQPRLATTLFNSPKSHFVQTSSRHRRMRSPNRPVNAQFNTQCPAVSPSIEPSTLYSVLCQKRAAEYEANLKQARLDAAQTSKKNKIRPGNLQQQLQDVAQRSPNSRTVFNSSRIADNQVDRSTQVKNDGRKVEVPSSYLKQTEQRNEPSNKIKMASPTNAVDLCKQPISPHGRPRPGSVGLSVSDGAPVKCTHEEYVLSPRSQFWNKDFPHTQDLKGKDAMKQQQRSPPLELTRSPSLDLPADNLELKDKTERWILKHMRLLQTNNEKTRRSRRSRSRRARTRPPIYRRQGQSRDSRKSHSVDGSLHSANVSYNSGMATVSAVGQCKQRNCRGKQQMSYSHLPSGVAARVKEEEILAPTIEVVYSAPRSLKSHSGCPANGRTTPNLTTKATLNCLNPSVRGRDARKRLRERCGGNCKLMPSSPNRESQTKSVERATEEKENQKTRNKDTAKTNHVFGLRNFGSSNRSKSSVGAVTKCSRNSHIGIGDNKTEQEEVSQRRTDKAGIEQSQEERVPVSVNGEMSTYLKRKELEKQNFKRGARGLSFSMQCNPIDSLKPPQSKQVNLKANGSFKENNPERNVLSISMQADKICKEKQSKHTGRETLIGKQEIPELAQDIESCKNPALITDICNEEVVNTFPSPSPDLSNLGLSWPLTKTLKNNSGKETPYIWTRSDSMPEKLQYLEENGKNSIVQATAYNKEATLSPISAGLDGSWPPTRALKLDSGIQVPYIWSKDGYAKTKLNATARNQSLDLETGIPCLGNSSKRPKAQISASQSIHDLLEEKSIENTRHRCGVIRQYILDKYACLRHKSMPCHLIPPLVDCKRKIRELCSCGHQENVDASMLIEDDQRTMNVVENTILSDSSLRTENKADLSPPNIPPCEAQNKDVTVTKDMLHQKENGRSDLKASDITKGNAGEHEQAEITSLSSPPSLATFLYKSTIHKVKEKSFLYKKSKPVCAQKGPPKLSLSAYDSLITELKRHYLLERLASLDNGDSIVEEVEEDFSGDWDECRIDDKTLSILTEPLDSASSNGTRDLIVSEADCHRSAQNVASLDQDFPKDHDVEETQSERQDSHGLLQGEIGVPVQCEPGEVLRVPETEQTEFGAGCENDIARTEVHSDEDLKPKVLRDITKFHLFSKYMLEPRSECEGSAEAITKFKKEKEIPPSITEPQVELSDQFPNKSPQIVSMCLEADMLNGKNGEEQPKGLKPPNACTSWEEIGNSFQISPTSLPISIEIADAYLEPQSVQGLDADLYSCCLIKHACKNTKQEGDAILGSNAEFLCGKFESHLLSNPTNTAVNLTNREEPDTVSLAVSVGCNAKAQEMPSSMPVDFSTCSPTKTNQINVGLDTIDSEVININDQFLEVAINPTFTSDSNEDLIEPVDLSLKTHPHEEIQYEPQALPLDLSTHGSKPGQVSLLQDFRNKIDREIMAQLTTETDDNAEPEIEISNEPLGLSLTKFMEFSEDIFVETDEEFSKDGEKPWQFLTNEFDYGNNNECLAKGDDNMVAIAEEEQLDVVHILQVLESRTPTYHLKEVSTASNMNGDTEVKGTRDNEYFEDFIYSNLANPYWPLMKFIMCDAILNSSLLTNSTPDMFWEIPLEVASRQIQPARRSSVQLVEIGEDPPQNTQEEKPVRMLEKAVEETAFRQTFLLNQSKDCDDPTEDRGKTPLQSINHCEHRNSEHVLTTATSGNSSQQIKKEDDLIHPRQHTTVPKPTLCSTSPSALTPTLPLANPGPCTKSTSNQESVDSWGGDGSSDFACISDWAGECRSCDQTESISIATLHSSSVSSANVAQTGCDRDLQAREPRGAVSVDSDSSFHSCCSICNLSSSQS